MASSWLGQQAATKTFSRKQPQGKPQGGASDKFGAGSSLARTASGRSVDDDDENPFAEPVVKAAGAPSRERLRTLSDNALSGAPAAAQDGGLVVKTKRKAKEQKEEVQQDQKKTRARATSPIATSTGHLPRSSPVCADKGHNKQNSASDASSLGSTYPLR
jgi:hypothetical protein